MNKNQVQESKQSYMTFASTLILSLLYSTVKTTTMFQIAGKIFNFKLIAGL